MDNLKGEHMIEHDGLNASEDRRSLWERILKLPRDFETTWSDAEVEDLQKRRERTEDVANQRIGFLLLFVGLVLGGAFATDSSILARVLLSWGTLASFIFVPPIWRAHVRHVTLCRIIEKHHREKDIATLVGDELSGCLFLVTSKKNWIGYFLPAFLALSLLAFALLGWLQLVPLGKQTISSAAFIAG